MVSHTRIHSTQRAVLLAFVGLLAMVFFGKASACEPCVDVLTLEETAERADLIVIGYALEGITPSEFDGNFIGPDWMTLAVTQVIKGELRNNPIRVNSWNGMCQYGIVLEDNASYVIFLQDVGDMYDAVEHGCAVKALPVFDSFVEIQGERIPLIDFFSQLGMDFQFESDTQESVKTPYLFIVGLVIGLSVLIILVIWCLRMKSGTSLD